MPLLFAIVIIPLANASWIAPKMNLQIGQREISQKFEFLAINTPYLAKSVKIAPEGVFSPKNGIIEPLMEKLALCESGNDPKKINPKDTNGKASFGKYQFQLSTWKQYILKYELFGSENWDSADFENNIWDGELQDEVIVKMFFDPNVNLRNEFPACSKKLKLKNTYGE